MKRFATIIICLLLLHSCTVETETEPIRVSFNFYNNCGVEVKIISLQFLNASTFYADRLDTVIIANGSFARLFADVYTSPFELNYYHYDRPVRVEYGSSDVFLDYTSSDTVNNPAYFSSYVQLNIASVYYYDLTFEFTPDDYQKALISCGVN